MADGHAALRGYREDEPDLDRFACHVLLTTATRTLRIDNLAGLDSFFSIPHQSYCYDFVSDWIRSKETGQLYRIARAVEEELRLPQRFRQLPPEELADTEIFPCVNECILASLMAEINDHIINVERILSFVQRRRTYLWYAEVQNFYEGIQEIAHMQDFYLKQSAGFHAVEPQKVWKEYTTYIIRWTHITAGSISRSHGASTPPIRFWTTSLSMWQIIRKHSTPTGFWENSARTGRPLPLTIWWIMGKSCKCLNSEIFIIQGFNMLTQGCLSLYLTPCATKWRFLWLRILRREAQANVKIDSCEGIFPTSTKFGMAALLMHKKLTTDLRSNGTLSVLADGMQTDAGYRDGILKNANKSSASLRYKDLIKMKRAERTAQVRGMDVVYIYHDKIDEAGYTDEETVFEACEETIAELKNLIQIIVNEFSETRIFLTSDHGFWYAYQPLTEDSKLAKTTADKDDVEVDRRYLIAKTEQSRNTYSL